MKENNPTGSATSDDASSFSHQQKSEDSWKNFEEFTGRLSDTVVNKLHPGHFFLFTSIPMCFAAHRIYRRPLNTYVQDRLHKSLGVGKSISGAAGAAASHLDHANPQVQTMIASVVARRALIVATLASVGTFGIFTSFVIYAVGWRSFSELGTGLKQSAYYFGFKNDLDQEIKKVEGMSYDEEMDYLSKAYFTEVTKEVSKSLDDTKDGRE